MVAGEDKKLFLHAPGLRSTSRQRQTVLLWCLIVSLKRLCRAKASHITTILIFEENAFARKRSRESRRFQRRRSSTIASRKPCTWKCLFSSTIRWGPENGILENEDGVRNTLRNNICAERLCRSLYPLSERAPPINDMNRYQESAELLLPIMILARYTYCSAVQVVAKSYC